MDSLFHFVFPIIAALAARLNIRHQVKTILALAFLTVLLDLDHLIPGMYRALLHNIFITFLLPLGLLAIAFHLKWNKYRKGFLLLLLIFLSSHVFLDMFAFYSPGPGIGIIDSGVALFYPFSNAQYSIKFDIKAPNVITMPSGEGYIVSSFGFGILLYFLLIILPCLFLDDIIEMTEKGHKKMAKTARKFFSNILKD